jgi:autotransporter-associated beta strand protein
MRFLRSLLFLAVALLLSSFAAASAQTSSQQLYLQCLTNFETYAETIWHTSGSIPDSGYWGDGASTGNGGIRGNSGIAVAYAALCLALPSDPRFATRLSRVRQALNYDYNTHLTGGYNTTSGNKWGWSGVSTDWQTPEWSGSMGLACILVETNLPAATVAGVRTVVVSEADHRAGIAPASGYVYDTKAEENAWQGNILALAAAWMSTSNNAPTWLSAAKSYLVNTYTVPNTNGDPLASWVTTQTLYPSFAIQNHSFYHPTYEMVAGMSSGDSLLMARVANPTIAAQLQAYAEHNVMAVWTNNLSLLVMDNGDFAYPASVDWAVRDFEHNSFLAWMAAHFNDPLARWADDKLAQCVRYHQIVNGDGTLVGTSANPGGGILFYREAVEARRTAIAWLHWNYADYPTGTMTAPTNALMYNTDVQVIHQRSAFGSFSVSYNVNGSRNSVMAIIEAASLSAPTNAFIASPRLPGILGLGALGNPTAATLVSFTTTATGFEAELKLTSSLGTTEEYIKSTGETFALIEVPRLNSGSTPSNGGSFICGIENDPLTGGSRVLEWSNNSASMTAMSGATRNVTNNWICVSGRYGLAAGPAGYFRYAATNAYRRVSAAVSEAGEAEDTLSFVENNQLAPRYAVWFPTRNALQTSNAAAAVTWVTNTTTATLTFPGAGGSATILTAFIGTSTNSNGAWSVDAGGNWSDPANWSSGTVADGATYTANFGAVNITADRTVTLDTARSIGTLRFGDPGGTQSWTITNASGSVLTLSNGSSSPAIAVTNTATLALPLAGASGFTKSGPGTLVLTGANPLSGTLYVDTQSTTTSDGAVRIAASGSVANVASPIYLRNNNSGSSTLQLDGSAGNVTVTQDISLAGRNAAVISIQNLSGSNALAGNFIFASGGANYWFDADVGTLTLAGLIPSSAPSVPNARILTFMGAGNILVSGTLNNANGYAVNLVKTNSGTLTLSSANSYSGTTTVSGGTLRVNNALGSGTGSGAVTVAGGGTLSGNGIISGTVTVQAGGTMSPGNAGIGTLTVSNSVTLAGSTLMEISHTGPTSDSFLVSGTLARGGALTVTNIGPALAAGDSFQLFTAASASGSFSSVTLPWLPAGLRWNTNQLASTGTISVEPVAPPLIAFSMLNGTNLVMQYPSQTGSSYVLQSATNLQPPVTWANVQTNVGDGGTQSFQTILDPQAVPQCFYRLQAY